MTRSLDPSVLQFLSANLGHAGGNRRFAEAVIEHLGAGPTAVWTQEIAAERVVGLLRSVYNTEFREALIRSPELMASAFQNADLLDPAEPASAALSRLVMSALERHDDG